MADVYYSPEKFNLEKVVEGDRSDGCYQFDLLVVWRDTKTGELYYGTDSGCSCPSPFEDQGLLDLALIAPESLESFEQAALAKDGDEGRSYLTPAEVQSIRREVLNNSAP